MSDPSITQRQTAPRLQNFLGGQWTAGSVEALQADGLPVFNPSTGEMIAIAPRGGPAEVDRAVQAAQQAFTGWSNTPPTRRAEILFRCRERLNAHRDELATLCRNLGWSFAVHHTDKPATEPVLALILRLAGQTVASSAPRITPDDAGIGQ